MNGGIPGQGGLGGTRKGADHESASQTVSRVPYPLFSVSSSCPAFVPSLTSINNEL